MVGRVGIGIGAHVSCGTRVIGTHTHALRARAHMRIYARAHTYARVRVRPHTRACARVCIGAGEGTPYHGIWPHAVLVLTVNASGDFLEMP